MENLDHGTVVNWVRRLHATTAKLNAPLWLDTMTTPGLSVKFYGQPDIEGREAVEPVFVGFFSQLTSMEHEMQVTDFAAPRIYHQCRVAYGLKRTGDTVFLDIQAVYHVRNVDGELRCSRMEIFGDPGELNRKMGGG